MITLFSILICLLIFAGPFDFSQAINASESSSALSGKRTEPISENRSQFPLMINEDNDHYFKKSSSKMNTADLQAFIDQFAGTKVTHILFCPNGQRTSYRSSVHESIWDNIDRYKKPDIWSVNCKLLFDKGIDPYKVWIDRCRQKGISPWLSMRMNDVHYATTPDYFRSTDHWRNHPQWWCKPYAASGGWALFAYDYSHEEVRQYHLALVEELLTLYDIDGFEMDWMRFCQHLTWRHEQEKSIFLTDFVKNVRALVKKAETKWGHKITLGARVPAAPDIAAAKGINAVEWCKAGLIDSLVVSPFFLATDHDISINLWKEQLGEKANSVEIVPAIDNGSSPYPGAPRTGNDPALLYGWVNEMYARGANAIYLFNWTYFDLTLPEFRTVLEEGLAPQIVLNKPRRHALAYRDVNPKGYKQIIQLPKTTDHSNTFSIDIGKKPDAKKVSVVLALTNRDGKRTNGTETEIKGTLPIVSLNGQKAEAANVLDSTKKYCTSASMAVVWTFDTNILKDGENLIAVEANQTNIHKIVWAEIATE
ncbi:MAG: hypothetical protein Q4G69_12690 [Planctomycetia bacterium]|nr:hypothetical protein [Planctomycetia bacterium]